MRSRWLLVSVLASILYVLVVGTAVYAATVTVRTGSYYFGSGSVSANVGDQLRFVMEDGGKGTPHTVEIDALGIHSGPLATKASYTTPELLKPGTYRIYCKPHENKGHVGTLTISGVATTTTTTTTTKPPTTTTSTTIDTSTSTTVPETTTTTTSPDAAVTTTTPGDSEDPTGTTIAGSTDTGTGDDAMPAPDNGTEPAAIDEFYVTAAGEEYPEGELVTIGVVEPSEIPWLRSIWLAVILAIPLAGLWIFASTRPRPAGVAAAETGEQRDDPAV